MGIFWSKKHSLKVEGERFCSLVCIYKNCMHEVRRVTPKMCEIFMNRLRSVFHMQKRCLVKFTILQCIGLSTNARGIKLQNYHIHIFCICVCSGSFRKRKKKQFFVQEFSADIKFHELTQKGGKQGAQFRL